MSRRLFLMMLMLCIVPSSAWAQQERKEYFLIRQGLALLNPEHRPVFDPRYPLEQQIVLIDDIDASFPTATEAVRQKMKMQALFVINNKLPIYANARDRIFTSARTLSDPQLLDSAYPFAMASMLAHENEHLKGQRREVPAYELQSKVFRGLLDRDRRLSKVRPVAEAYLIELEAIICDELCKEERLRKVDELRKKYLGALETPGRAKNKAPS